MSEIGVCIKPGKEWKGDMEGERITKRKCEGEKWRDKGAGDSQSKIDLERV